jgi:hypothetical protein
MTTEVSEKPNLAASRYVPEGYTATINTMLNYPWPEGTTNADIRAAEHALMRIVIEVAEKAAAGELDDAWQLVAEKLPGLPEEWSPLAYFEASAQQMAIPVWDEYTEEQRRRGHQYAARYAMARLAEWLRLAHKHNPGAEDGERFVLSEQTRAARWAFTEQFAAKTEYRRRLAQMQAYLATHTDEEFVPGQMRAIAARWSDFNSEQAFF